jgi:hypothetical protein
MNNAVTLRSPTLSRASLSQRVARIEVPPLSSLSQPQTMVRSPELSMRT